MDQFELQRQIDEIKNTLGGIDFSSGVPRDVETALKERLNMPDIISGHATFVGGKYDVVDNRINSQSLGVATRSGTSTNATQYNLASGFLSPNIMRFFEGSFSDTYDIDYIVII